MTSVPATSSLEPRRLRRTVLWSLVAVWSAFSGCKATGSLTNARSSEEALVEAVLEALSEGDQERLEALLVTREEYETLLWPAMPDGKYTPFEFVWGLNQANSRKGLRQLVHGYGSLPLELVSVELPNTPEKYRNFSLHQGVEVTLRRVDTGDVGILASFDVLVEYGGGWKLLNYDEL
jgi:hypothetical protein